MLQSCGFNRCIAVFSEPNCADGFSAPQTFYPQLVDILITILCRRHMVRLFWNMGKEFYYVTVSHLHSASNSYKYTSTTINWLYTTIIYQKLMISNILPTFTSLITLPTLSPSWPKCVAHSWLTPVAQLVCRPDDHTPRCIYTWGGGIINMSDFRHI